MLVEYCIQYVPKGKVARKKKTVIRKINLLDDFEVPTQYIQLELAVISGARTRNL